MKTMDDSMAHSGDVLAPFDLPGWKTWVSWTAAVLMASLFLVAGLWKITDAPAFAVRLAQLKVPQELTLPASVLLGIVETFAAVGQDVYWTNAVTEVVVGDGARLDFHRVQRESVRAYHIAATQTHQGRDSTVNLHAVAFGGALARHDIGSVLAGPGGTLILNGLYLLSDAQHADHHTTIDHAADHCQSHEYFNGVLDGRSRGVFTGRIVVRPGAQKTDSKQTNNNLLLSSEAHADSQPQLEIYADDVKCTHGSTVGPLDPRALFYLRSRGVSESEARRLMTYGFGAEVLGRMDVVPLREQLDRIVRERLAQS